MAEVIALYAHHGMHEQFHSEIKSDLDLERLPSGKSDTNDAILQAAQLVAHARRLVLDFGRNVTQHVKVFVALQERLWQAASP
jgi:hypothetical protein